jgi:DNA-binding MarR family transcriptional regulator
MGNDFRLANETWNTFYRAAVTIARGFADADIWEGLLTSEYAVLHALSAEPGGMRMSQLKQDALLTQPGMSRLIARLEAGGLVQRREDRDDARARRICLTPRGADLQQRVGASVARAIADAMQPALTTEQLHELRALSTTLLRHSELSRTRVAGEDEER